MSLIKARSNHATHRLGHAGGPETAAGDDHRQRGQFPPGPADERGALIGPLDREPALQVLVNQLDEQKPPLCPSAREVIVQLRPLATLPGILEAFQDGL